MTHLVWLFIASSIAISALIAFPLRLGAARAALRSLLRSSSLRLRQDRQGTARMVLVSAAVFLLVAGIGVATSYLRDRSNAIGSGRSPQHSGSDNGEMLTSLKDYTRSLGSGEAEHGATPGKLLPDVNTMMERLAARLETAPGDAKGWRMLGWSYFHTGRYSQAATALAKAVELDPNSDELKLAYEEAKAKAADGGASETASSFRAETVGKAGDGAEVEKNAKPVTGAPREHIQSMVDGLAARLESAPGDVDGWMRLMRSRVVLGEREVAATAFRKALEVFKDDAAAMGKITASAVELGLKSE